MTDEEIEKYFEDKCGSYFEATKAEIKEDVCNAFKDGYNKANEWHFVKDLGLPKKDGMYLFYLYDKNDTLDYFCEVFDISDTAKDPYLETSLWDVEDVIAWKEIEIPELKENE